MANEYTRSELDSSASLDSGIFSLPSSYRSIPPDISLSVNSATKSLLSKDSSISLKSAHFETTSETNLTVELPKEANSISKEDGYDSMKESRTYIISEKRSPPDVISEQDEQLRKLLKQCEETLKPEHLRYHLGVSEVLDVLYRVDDENNT